MITVEEAHKIVLQHTSGFGTEKILLENCLGRVLREEIVADRDFPPYDRVTMDGIAICYESFANGQRSFEIAGVAPAGGEVLSLNSPKACVEVMTGSCMPLHFDTVIRYEDVSIENGIATVTIEKIDKQQNIHFKGEDRKAGEVVISPGKVISSAEIGVCATVGKAFLEVSRLPKTAVISTGDELVEITETPKAHQIRRSNVYRLQTVLKNYQAEVDTYHLDDDYDTIVEELGNIVNEYQLVIISGGVSKGKFDYLPEALSSIGVTKQFHKIAQRPGKPFWYGTHQETSVFAFPGNPVSSFMCMLHYFLPWLDKSLGMDKRSQAFAMLMEDVTFKPDLTYFLEVNLEFCQNGLIRAHPVKGNGSGDLANLVDADAFIKLPRGSEIFKEGGIYPILPFRRILY